MTISRDQKKKKVWLSQEKYIEKVLEWFHKDKAKSVATPLANHFTLSSNKSPKSEIEKMEIHKVPYVLAVGNLIYGMTCTLPNIAYTVGVVGRFLSKPGKKH